MAGRGHTSARSILRSSDTALAVILAGLGLAGVAYAASTQAQPFAMLPGMDGALTMGVLGFGFALLHGMRYRDVLRMLIPVLGVQVGGCLVHGESIVAIVGLELAFVGVVGIAMAAVLSSVSPRPADRRRQHHRAIAAAAMASPASTRGD